MKDSEDLISEATNLADETRAQGVQKPRMLVEYSSPEQTVASLRDVLASAGALYDRGVPVRLTHDRLQHCAYAQIVTPDCLVLIAHMQCRPYTLKEKGGQLVEANVRLPRNCAAMYLEWRGEWRLPPLNGITSAPLLKEDGTINSSNGYDSASGVWCENMPDLTGLVPDRPSKEAATAALRLLRNSFRTFCFADSHTIIDPATGLAVVDITRPPGQDESGLLAGLATAVCRASVPLAPGLLLKAAPVSGAGSGKGLLARCICAIAYGQKPHAVTGGGTAEELEKRIAAELMQGGPVVFLDNLNNTAVKSDLLASALTEIPARVRVLGKSQMVSLNSSAFVILTGNGLTVAEDLSRRFITVNLDARIEDPETRAFKTDILTEVFAQRTELLAAILTIWRWGMKTSLAPGLPLGSFQQRCCWVRDPLIALGCQDVAARVAETKIQDARRQDIARLFENWSERHGANPVAVRDLDVVLVTALDPQGRGRQYVAARLEKLVGTRLAGFVLTRQAAAGKWGAATYSLAKTSEHRAHRGLGGNGSDAPYGPYAH